MPPPLGWIEPVNRTQAQHAAHAGAMGSMVKFSLPAPQLFKGQKIALYDNWKHPDVVADVGFVFERIHQITGSCVWAGGTNAMFTTIATQRIVGDSPTKAFLPFTLHNYGLSRHYCGLDSPGDGSLGSTFSKSLTQDGLRDWTANDGLPTWTNNDGISVTQNVEYAFSTYKNPDIAKILTVSKNHLLGSAAECNDVQDIKSLIANGYGVAFACNNYIGSARVQGSGADACLIGYWDSPGGHQQSIHAVWEHPQFGPLYWAQNNWPGSTYPRDPAGGPECGCWVTEAKVAQAMRLDSEVYGYSRLNWFPAQPKVLDWSQI